MLYGCPFAVSNTSYTQTVVEQGFGQRRPPLTELIKSILTRYPDGGQILKVYKFVCVKQSHFEKLIIMNVFGTLNFI